MFSVPDLSFLTISIQLFRQSHVRWFHPFSSNIEYHVIAVSTLKTL